MHDFCCVVTSRDGESASQLQTAFADLKHSTSLLRLKTSQTEARIR